MAAPAALQPISSEDILRRNLDALFGQFGGMDPKGDNEVGAQMRLLAQALFPVLASRFGLQNELIPNVEDAYRQSAFALSPEGTQQLYNDQAARLQSEAATRGNVNASRVRAAGASPLAAEGERLAAQNQATSAGNNYLNQLFSPQMMLQRAQMLGDLQGNASGNLVGQQIGMGNFIEGRSQANKADKARGGMNGILGSLGNLAGLASSFGGFPGLGATSGAGGGGGGGFNPLTMSDWGMPGDLVGPNGFILGGGY